MHKKKAQSSSCTCLMQEPDFLLSTLLLPSSPSRCPSARLCPVQHGVCCRVVTCGGSAQLHRRFLGSFLLLSCFFFFNVVPSFSSPSCCRLVQSASICHCLSVVPPGKMGLILQSISRRAAFVLCRAPVGAICFTAPLALAPI